MRLARCATPGLGQARGGAAAGLLCLDAARRVPSGLTLPAQRAQTLADVPPDEALQAQYVDRTPCTMAVQVGPEYSEHEARWKEQATGAPSG